MYSRVHAYMGTMVHCVSLKWICVERRRALLELIVRTFTPYLLLHSVAIVRLAILVTEEIAQKVIQLLAEFWTLKDSRMTYMNYTHCIFVCSFITVFS